MRNIKLEIKYNKQCRADILKQVFEIFVKKESIFIKDNVITVWLPSTIGHIIFNELEKQPWIDSFIISDLGPDV